MDSTNSKDRQKSVVREKRVRNVKQSKPNMICMAVGASNYHYNARWLPHHQGVLAKTTGTATATPQNKNIIGWKRKNARAARATRISVHFFAVLHKTTT